MKAIVLGLVSLLLVSCGHSQRFGDARLVSPSNLCVTALTSLKLPKFDVSQQGRFEFTVTGAPKDFAGRLNFSHNSDLRHIDSGNLIVDVTIVDDRGNRILQRRLKKQNDWRIKLGNAERNVIMQLPQYVVIVTVVRPIPPLVGVKMRGHLESL